MIELKGNWVEGYAFDKHIIHSDFLGHNQWGYPMFDNTHSQIGKLVKKLKYNHDISTLPDILSLLKADTEFNVFISKINIIVPVPPSNKVRPIQPVFETVKELSREYNKEIIFEALQTTNTEQIKNLDTDEKYERVKSSLIINEANLDKNQNILIVDDLFDSGSTMNAYVDALKEKGYNNIYIFALTKTRNSD